MGQNFKELIERNAVRIIGPDPCDVGGIAELKWIAEFADLHGVMIAPHGTGNGLLGLAALAQVCATLPNNFIAFEYPSGDPAWWYDIVDGLPDPIVRNGLIEVWDRRGWASRSFLNGRGDIWRRRMRGSSTRVSGCERSPLISDSLHQNFSSCSYTIDNRQVRQL